MNRRIHNPVLPDGPSGGSLRRGAGRSLAWLVLLPVLLSACVPGGPATVTRAMAVSGGSVVVAGPPGYCIDRSVSRDKPDGAFVLFGTCAALSGSRAAGQPASPALLTVSVSPGASDGQTFAESLPALASFMRSVPGRAALSRSGDAAQVSVEDIRIKGDVMFLRVRDRSAASDRPVEPEYWRAILRVEEHIVTLTALSPSERPVAATERLRALEALVRAMRAANKDGTTG